MRSPEHELQTLEDAQLIRSLKNTRPHLLNFASNDYLGLSHHPELIAASIEATQKWGTGSAGSRLITGNLPPHTQLEHALADAKNTQASRVFSTGYATALGTLTALAGKGDTIILDKLSHASLIDAARLSGATIRIFPHNHLGKLERLLTAHQPSSNTRTIVVTESVFSMDGDHASLQEIVDLKDKYGAWLLLDEAHGFGILGETGMGLAEERDLQSRVELQMGTLSKAAGSAGGYIAASRAIIDLITNKARSFIYSTAPPPAQAAASLAALHIIRSPEGARLRRELYDAIATFQGAHTLSPIQPVILGDNTTTLQAAATLEKEGYLISPIRYPTVPRNTARLRITLTARHTKTQIRQLSNLVQSIKGPHRDQASQG